MSIKRFSAGLFAAAVLALQLSPVALAADQYRYGVGLQYFADNTRLEINDKNAGVLDPGSNEFILDKDDRATLTISFDQDDVYLSDGSRFLRFASTQDGTTTTTYTRRDAVLLPDGSYMAVRPVSETLVMEELRLGEDQKSLEYGFRFEGVYEAVPILLEEIREAAESNGTNSLWNGLDTTKPTTLRIKGRGQTDTPLPLSNELNESAVLGNYALAAGNGLSAEYEVNSGSGWELFEILSWEEGKDNREAMHGGKNYIYDAYPLTLRTAYGEPTTYELLDSISAKDAAVAAAAAAGAATIASAVAGVSRSSSADDKKSKPSILINGGGAYPELANTEKSTVELLLNMDSSDGQIYRWTAVAASPDCIKAAVASAVPPFGASSTAVIMISGQKLPKNKIPVFLEITATGMDGEKITASAELPLYEKGLFARLEDPGQPLLPQSYAVTRICDANLDGLAEIKQLKPEEYTVEATDQGVMIHYKDQSVVLPL